MKRIIITTVLMLAVSAGAAHSKIWRLNPAGTGDAPTIQAAVGAAASGDAILLEPGVYYEKDILIDGKNLAIDQTGSKAVLVSPTPGSGVGFTIRNVTAAFTLNSITFRGFGTAVSVESGSPYVNWIVIKACGIGLLVSGAATAPTMSYTLVDSCSTGIDVQGGGVFSLSNETIVNCSVGALFAGGSPTLRWSIVASCGTGVSCSGSPTLTCNDLWNNGANYGGCSAGPTDFTTDPIFCFLTAPSPDLYYLHDSSPCWTGANPCSKKIGAFVSRTGCTGTSVRTATWGAIKAMYR